MRDQLAIHMTDAANTMQRLGPEALLATHDRIMEMLRSTDPLTKQIGRFAVIGMGMTVETCDLIAKEATECPPSKT